SLQHHIMPQHVDASCRWLQQPANTTNRGRFRRAIRTQQSKDPPRLRRERDIGEGHEITVFLLQLFDFDHQTALAEPFPSLVRCDAAIICASLWQVGPLHMLGRANVYWLLGSQRRGSVRPRLVVQEVTMKYTVLIEESEEGF